MEKGIAEPLPRTSSPDPFEEIEDVVYRLDTLRSEEDVKPKARLQAIEDLDRRAQPHIDALTRQYTLEEERLPRVQEERIRSTVVECWRHLAATYEDCFWQYQAGERGAAALKSSLPAIVSRAIRYLGAELKWTVMAYGPGDPTLWGRMGALYAIAEQASMVDEPCVLGDPGDLETSIRQEYLRSLMFTMAAVDTLTPLRIDLADRLAGGFVHAFMMQTQPGKGCHYYVDLSAAKPPARLVDRLQSPAPNPRYYGPGKAGVQAEKLIELIQARGEVPDDLGLGHDFPVDIVIEVLRHLARQWASIPPARGQEREASSARLHIVHDFDTVLQAVASNGRNAALDRKTETWNVRDVSEGGFGALLMQTPQDWLRVGTLVAVRLEGTISWGVGVIQRMSTPTNTQRLVGIRMVSHGGTPVVLHGAESDAANAIEPETALLLLSSGEATAGRGEILLLLKTGSFCSHRPVRMELHGQSYQLMPKQLTEAGRDFEMVRFRVMGR